MKSKITVTIVGSIKEFPAREHLTVGDEVTLQTREIEKGKVPVIDAVSGELVGRVASSSLPELEDFIDSTWYLGYDFDKEIRAVITHRLEIDGNPFFRAEIAEECTDILEEDMEDGVESIGFDEEDYDEEIVGAIMQEADIDEKNSYKILELLSEILKETQQKKACFFTPEGTYILKIGK